MAAGVVAGLVWPHLVPEVEMQMTELGPYPVSETEAGELMVMDGWFALLGGGLGLLCGSVLATVFLRYGSIMVLALLGGSCAAALLAFTVGTIGGNGEVVLAWNPQASPGTSLTAPLQLHAYGVALLWPIATLAPVAPLAWWAWPYEEEDDADDTVHGSEGGTASNS